MITVEHLTRSFGSHLALDDVSFEIHDNKMTGFIGGNGAGKTTTMRIMMGVLAADRGRVLFNGHEITGEDRSQIGYMPEERGLYPKMTVRDQLEYFARLHGLSAADAKRSAAHFIKALDLEQYGDKKIESLSLGNQQKAQIAATLVHRPSALVLDEPFSGLDPIAVDRVLSVLREMCRQTGAPILFSSHQLDIVDQLCDNIAIIAKGKICATGDKDEIRSKHSRAAVSVRLNCALSQFADFPGITIEETQRTAGTLIEHEPGAAQRFLRHITSDSEVQVISFTPYQPRLSEIFKELVQ